MAGEPPPNGDDDSRGSGNAAVAIGIVLLLAVAWLVMHFYIKNQQMENCRIEGRRDCDPISVPSQ
jgi:hypothetical protein